MTINELKSQNINTEGNKLIFNKQNLKFKNIIIKPSIDREGTDWYSTYSLEIINGDDKIELEKEKISFTENNSYIFIYNDNIELKIYKRNLKFIIYTRSNDFLGIKNHIKNDNYFTVDALYK